jgi:capsular polysaccharide transport system permease protein
MQPSSLKIRSLINEINSLKRQIISQQDRWSDSESGKTVTSVVLDAERLKSELAFAEKVYINAVTSLKQAQIETTQKQRYLDVIVQPHLPDESVVPDRLLSILTTFLASLMIWGIISLVLTSIKDHLGWA